MIALYKSRFTGSLLFFLALSSPVVFAETDASPNNPVPSNLIQVYRHALQFNPSYLKQQANSLASQEDIAISRAALLPQVTASLGANYQNGGGTHDAGLTMGNPSIVVSQTLINPAAWGAVSTTKTNALIAQLTTIQQRQTLFSNVVTAYYDLAQAQYALRVSQQAEADKKKLLQEAKVRFEAGQTQRTDTSNAQAAYANAQSAILSNQKALINAQYKLQQLSGLYKQTVAEFNPKEPWASFQIHDRGYWLNNAKTRSVDIKIKEWALINANQAIKQAKQGHLPTLSAQATYSPSLATSSSDLLDRSTEFRAGVSLNVPIYSGGSQLAKTRQSYDQYKMAQQDLRDTQQNAYNQINQAYNEATHDLETLKIQKKLIALSQQALHDTWISYEAGFKFVNDVLIEQESLSQAQAAYAKTVYNYFTNILILKKSAGILDDRDIELLNQWLA